MYILEPSYLNNIEATIALTNNMEHSYDTLMNKVELLEAQNDEAIKMVDATPAANSQARQSRSANKIAARLKAKHAAKKELHMIPQKQGSSRGVQSV